MFKSKTMNHMKFHEKLSLMAKQRGMSQASLAKLLGDDVSQSSLSNWMSGKHVPPIDVAFRISKALRVSLDYLADDAISGLAAADDDTQNILITEMFVRLGPEEIIRRLLYPPQPDEMHQEIEVRTTAQAGRPDETYREKRGPVAGPMQPIDRTGLPSQPRGKKSG
jgi:transcriptional regulator with XRE-family HTH domain